MVNDKIGYKNYWEVSSDQVVSFAHSVFIILGSGRTYILVLSAPLHYVFRHTKSWKLSILGSYKRFQMLQKDSAQDPKINFTTYTRNTIT